MGKNNLPSLSPAARRAGGIVSLQYKKTCRVRIRAPPLFSLIFNSWCCCAWHESNGSEQTFEVRCQRDSATGCRGGDIRRYGHHWQDESDFRIVSVEEEKQGSLTNKQSTPPCASPSPSTHDPWPLRPCMDRQ